MRCAAMRIRRWTSLPPSGTDFGLPVLVYQGLGGNHSYDNDRHHTFIMQGARDAHRELQERGMRAVFHLDRKGDQPSPLRQLVTRAAAVVVEDFPAPPFPRWTERLAAPLARCRDRRRLLLHRTHAGPAQAVHPSLRLSTAQSSTSSSGACLCPGRISNRRSPSFAGELGFEPLDLERADIAELCASCAIDHSIPPVAHTVGGSGAGYARWQRFLQSGLGGVCARS